VTYNISVLEYVLRLTQMDIHCMLEIWCYMCDHVILDNNNKTVPLPPAVPTASATVQPTCGTPSGTITISTQSGVEYSVNGTAYQSSNSFQFGSGELYLICQKPCWPKCDHPGSTTTINSIPPPLFRQLRVLLSLHVLCNLEVLVLPRNQELNIV
jgi:hypothetical protein